MVTRVDKKPIIYSTTAVRAWRPMCLLEDSKLLRDIIKKSRGHKIPRVNPVQLFEDIDDINSSFSIFGEVEDIYDNYNLGEDEIDDESIRLARLVAPKDMGRRATIKANNLAETSNKVVRQLLEGAESVYYGTEGVYMLYTHAVNGDLFEHTKDPHYWDWAQKTAQSAVMIQSPYLFIHPSATENMTTSFGVDMPRAVMRAWSMFKKCETICLRLGSRKNLFAHAYHSGVSKRAFEPSAKIEEDFELPLTGFVEAKLGFRMFSIGGLKYYVVGSKLIILSHDDCINMSTMAQCYFRVALYFSRSNGYPAHSAEKALSLVRDIAGHACTLIECGMNFSHIIRSMHILAQRDFNDIFEDDFGMDLGWSERSENYTREARELDRMGEVFHKRALELAVDKIDELNIGFIYHVFVGDEMLLDDLRNKVKGMSGKVLDADKDEWATFIKFSKSYMLARYMMTHGRKPKVSGDFSQMNEKWAERCCNKIFTMPPQTDWGKVWISGEFAWSTHANSWHLEAQDVAYVYKDSEGLKHDKYVKDRLSSCELLMAMTSGDILDTLTGSTPTAARERITAGDPVREVVLTTAPKAENAKPSWKKRVTFAADCEFRKMQAEYDRNCRKIISFVRGPSLGVDQGALEKQFQDICNSTAFASSGAVCSHDISAWSESMDRGRKFEFESILVNMLTKPEMINIQHDWAKIKATVLKGGAREVVAIDNSSFQGFDGSASTILHAMILIYCIDSARRQDVMTSDIKANMATLIDDCVALMNNMDNRQTANAFWAHLKTTYRKLGFEVDDLKSIFSTIKAIYLSRRFLVGGEVPADFKVFIKSHISYEDPLRCSLDAVSDIFGANRGAADANGDAWFVYYTSYFNSLLEIAHQNPFITDIPPTAAAIFSLAPVSENGWGFPSIVDWGTNDIIDKRTHFNAILENAARHSLASDDFKRGVDAYTIPAAKAIGALKSQAWRIVSYANIFTNPFEAIREGPLKPDMLRRNAVSDLLGDIATAEPWCTLLSWSNSATTKRIRELLINSGPLHAPTLSALVNCMPDNYRLSLVGKATGSNSVLDMLPMGERSLLKRRIHRCATNYFKYSVAVYSSSNMLLNAEDIGCLSFKEQTIAEREEFYAANGVVMTDHTFPDPVATFTHSKLPTGSMICPNDSKLRVWDARKPFSNRVSQLISGRGIYVPKRSGRVWEITSEYAKGWDTVSQRIAMGLAVLARAKADGHGVNGIQEYFIKAWNEASNITPDDTHLISIHGSIKRLDSNPGSASHPIIFSRNILQGFNNILTTAKEAIAVKSKEITGSASHLHDLLAHDTCMLAVTALHFGVYSYLGAASSTLTFNMAARPDCIIAESPLRMKTNTVSNRIAVEILDSELPYGLLQACPKLVGSIAIPTMKSSWAKMINCLIEGRHDECEEIIKEAHSIPLDDYLHMVETDNVSYSAYVVLAEAPARRGTLTVDSGVKFAVRPTDEEAKMKGDCYTLGVRTITSRISRAMSSTQPEHVTCATAIKSVVWERMRASPVMQLAKVLYEDPDADYGMMKQYTKFDFWKGVVSEANRHKRKMILSEIMMSGFRSLGIPGIHISSSRDLSQVTQAVASYFGANIREIIKIVGPEVLSVAGRNARDFDAPIMQRFITNNPAMANAKMRREHMGKLIEFNLGALKERICAIINNKITHRGDKRACEINDHARLVELRCRRYVYKHCKVTECGAAVIDEEALGKKIHACAILAAGKIGRDASIIPAVESTFEGVLQFMHSVYKAIRVFPNWRKAGWDPASGNIGARIAYDNIMTDSGHVVATKFAVSSAELAPRVHKRVITSYPSEPLPQDYDGVTESLTDMVLDHESTEAVGIEDMLDVKLNFTPKLTIPAWQGLYTLAYVSKYQPEELNNLLGTELTLPITFSQLREARLNEFDDDDLYEAFPTLTADYLACGVAFSPTWLDRDEADAYMVDEEGAVARGSLF